MQARRVSLKHFQCILYLSEPLKIGNIGICAHLLLVDNANLVRPRRNKFI
jgi:hypothetical protein